MELFFARAADSCKAVLPVLATMVLLAGCIPSEPQTTNAPTAPPTAVAVATPPVQTPSVAPSHEGQPGASLKMDPAAKSNASVTVESMKDGGGFNVRGTFNLTGTIVPNGPGKWKLSGQFSVAEPDFAVGAPLASSMGTFGATKDGATGMSTDTALVLIDLPVRPPAAKAPEGTAPRSIPVSLDIEAPPNAQFTVTLTQMQAQ